MNRQQSAAAVKADNADLNFDPDATFEELEAYAKERLAPDEVGLFRPAADWLLVEPETEPEMTESGLYTVREETPHPVRGRVLKAGPEADAAWVGDRVLFGKYMGVKVELDGNEYLLLHAKSDVYGRLEDWEE